VLRESFFLFLFKISENFYRAMFKRNKKAWQTTKYDLKQMGPNSIGYHYYKFLDKNGYDILPKLENHDLFHVITQANTNVRDELALQYYLLGNGKRSIYQYCVLISSILWLDEVKYFIKAFKNGMNSKPFSHVKFESILKNSIHKFRNEKSIKMIGNNLAIRGVKEINRNT